MSDVPPFRVHTYKNPIDSSPIDLSRRDNSLRPLDIGTHTSSYPRPVLAPSKSNTEQVMAKPKHGETSREPRRPKALGRIPTMPVPSRSDTLSIHTSPKKKQKMAIDAE